MKNLLLSAAIGDIAGSAYERYKNSTKRYGDVRLFHPDVHFTDDTVCTFACAEALLHGYEMGATLYRRCVDHLFAGYGSKFQQWLRSRDPKPYRSIGNGSAMRCSGAGWLAQSEEECVRLATETAMPTHNHPEGIKGAVATALAIYHLKNGKDKDFVRREVLEKYYPEWANKEYVDFHDDFAFDATCPGTVPPAIICFLESSDFCDCLRLAISLGGDADTLAAIAAPMAYAFYREMPQELVDKALALFPDWMTDLNDAFDCTVAEKGDCGLADFPGGCSTECAYRKNL